MSSLFQILAHAPIFFGRRLARRRQWFTRRRALMQSSTGAGPK